MAAIPIYGKTKYVLLQAVVDLDLSEHYLKDQVSASGLAFMSRINSVLKGAEH